MKKEYAVLIFNISFLFVIITSSYLVNQPVAFYNESNTNSRNTIKLDNDVDLTILHINDLHGWLNPHDGYGGVATYMGYFYEEGFDPTVENSHGGREVSMGKPHSSLTLPRAACENRSVC